MSVYSASAAEGSPLRIIDYFIGLYGLMRERCPYGYT